CGRGTRRRGLSRSRRGRRRLLHLRPGAEHHRRHRAHGPRRSLTAGDRGYHDIAQSDEARGDPAVPAARREEVAMARTVGITGASSGIGAALASTLAGRGDRVALAARRADELRALAGRLGSNARAVPTDVTRRADVERLRDEAIEAFGAIDVWVNNAGRGLS